MNIHEHVIIGTYPSSTLLTEATEGRDIISRSSSANLKAAARTRREDFCPILNKLYIHIIIRIIISLQCQSIHVIREVNLYMYMCIVVIIVLMFVVCVFTKHI